MNHCFVGESLWKISELTFVDRIVFFGKETEIVAQSEQPFEQLPRVVFSPDQMQTRSQPKRARQKNTFLARQTVNAFLGRPITQNQTVLHQLALNRNDRSANTLVRRR